MGCESNPDTGGGLRGSWYARLTPKGRWEMVKRVKEGASKSRVAREMGVPGVGFEPTCPDKDNGF